MNRSHKIHYAGVEIRIVLRDDLDIDAASWSTLYQADCEQMRLTAIYSGSDPIEGRWISLLNSTAPAIMFAYPIDVQIRPKPGVRTPHEEERNPWN